jgi:hypothetical protein
MKNHESPIDQPIRCQGKNRNEQTKTLMLDGLTNTRSENILNNYLNNDQSEHSF